MLRPNNILAFDCSISGCSAIVRADAKVLARAEAPASASQAEALMPLIERVMAESGVAWSALDLIGVTVGPGSFTGICIGLSAARGFALALDITAVGVATTEVLACSVPRWETERGHPILVAIDSKRGDLFVQPFAAHERWSLAPVAAMSPEAAARLLPQPPVLVGDGAARLLPLIPGAILSEVARPDPSLLAVLAHMRLEEGRALPLEPLYLRPADVTLPGAPP